MASTPEGGRLTNAHQRELLKIKARAVSALMAINPDLDWVEFEKVWPEWVSFAYRICAENRKGAALLTAAYLKNHRLVEGVPGEMVPMLAEALDREMFTVSMNATMRKRLMDAAYKSSLIEDPGQRGLYLKRERRKAMDEAAGSFARHVLNGSRETIERTGRADRRALGWARITDGSPCAFCAMMVSRGPVYKSEATAGRNADPRFVGDGTFKNHDGCGCGAELVYSDNYEVLGKAEEFENLWYESTDGLTGKDKLRAFRSAYEGR